MRETWHTGSTSLRAVGRWRALVHEHEVEGRLPVLARAAAAAGGEQHALGALAVVDGNHLGDAALVGEGEDGGRMRERMVRRRIAEGEG